MDFLSADAREDWAVIRFAGGQGGTRFASLDEKALQAKVEAAFEFLRLAMAFEAFGLENGPYVGLEGQGALARLRLRGAAG